MFETLFSDVLNSEHELLRAARLIDWNSLHDALSMYYSPVVRQGKSIRLMDGIHILKYRYDCSDERAVEMLHENSYWQCFCGFNMFQGGQILEASSLVKFRNRIGTEGIKRIEAVLLKVWSDMGLVKTRRVSVDTTAQPKNIAHPTDADLLHRIREKIGRQIRRVREEVPLPSLCGLVAIILLAGRSVQSSCDWQRVLLFSAIRAAGDSRSGYVGMPGLSCV